MSASFLSKNPLEMLLEGAAHLFIRAGVQLAILLLLLHDFFMFWCWLVGSTLLYAISCLYGMKGDFQRWAWQSIREFQRRQQRLERDLNQIS